MHCLAELPARDGARLRNDLSAIDRWKVLDNRFIASFLAVVVIAFFAFYKIGGRPAGLALWRLFGTTNQLLAGLARPDQTVLADGIIAAGLQGQEGPTGIDEIEAGQAVLERDLRGEVADAVLEAQAPLLPQSQDRERDEHLRPDTTLEILESLPTVFGDDSTVTAGNASTINDGA